MYADEKKVLGLLTRRRAPTLGLRWSIRLPARTIFLVSQISHFRFSYVASKTQGGIETRLLFLDPRAIAVVAA